MSRSDDRPARFDTWVAEEFAATGPFTVLIVLVGIRELSITPLRSTWLHVIGDELAWPDVAKLFDGAGAAWDGVLFAPRTDMTGGPLPDAAARLALRDLGDQVLEDRTVLNAEHFFDRKGRRLRVEEVPAQ